MRKIASYLLVLVLCTFAQRAWAQIMVPDFNIYPSYSQIRYVPNLLSLHPGFNKIKIEGLNANKESNRDAWEAVADFYVMVKAEPKGKVDFMTARSHPRFFDGKPPNYQGIYDDYKTQKKSVALVVAGAFECAAKTRTLEGFALDKGVNVGTNLILGGRHNMFFEITLNNEPRLYDIFGMEKSKVEQLTQRFTDEKVSVFQQFPVIRNSKVVLTSDEQHFYRFYVDQQHWFMDKNFQGVINFTRMLTLTDAANITTKLKTDEGAILNAMYLDVGGLSEGAEFNTRGELTPISSSIDTLGDVIEWFSSDHFTNLLVFYSDK